MAQRTIDRRKFLRLGGVALGTAAAGLVLPKLALGAAKTGPASDAGSFAWNSLANGSGFDVLQSKITPSNAVFYSAILGGVGDISEDEGLVVDDAGNLTLRWLGPRSSRSDQSSIRPSDDELPVHIDASVIHFPGAVKHFTSGRTFDLDIQFNCFLIPNANYDHSPTTYYDASFGVNAKNGGVGVFRVGNGYCQFGSFTVIDGAPGASEYHTCNVYCDIGVHVVVPVSEYDSIHNTIQSNDRFFCVLRDLDGGDYQSADIWNAPFTEACAPYISVSDIWLSSDSTLSTSNTASILQTSVDDGVSNAVYSATAYTEGVNSLKSAVAMMSQSHTSDNYMNDPVFIGFEYVAPQHCAATLTFPSLGVMTLKKFADLSSLAS